MGRRGRKCCCDDDCNQVILRDGTDWDGWTDAPADVGLPDGPAEFSTVNNANAAYRSGSVYHTNQVQIYVGDYEGDINDCVMRFPNITIPPGAKINSATLTVKMLVANSGVTARAGFEAVDNATLPVSVAEITAATLTASTVDFNISALGLGEDKQFPDLATSLQEVVDRPGWASGNAINYFVRRVGSNDTLASWAVDPFEGPIPVLTVEYTAEYGVLPAGDTTSIIHPRPSCNWAVDIEIDHQATMEGARITAGGLFVEWLEEVDATTSKIKLGNLQCFTIEVAIGSPLWIRFIEANEGTYYEDPNDRHFKIEVWDGDPEDDASSLINSKCVLRNHQLCDAESQEVEITLAASDIAPLVIGMVRAQDTQYDDPDCVPVDCFPDASCESGGPPNYVITGVRAVISGHGLISADASLDGAMWDDGTQTNILDCHPRQHIEMDLSPLNGSFSYELWSYLWDFDAGRFIKDYKVSPEETARLVSNWEAGILCEDEIETFKDRKLGWSTPTGGVTVTGIETNTASCGYEWPETNGDATEELSYWIDWFANSWRPGHGQFPQATQGGADIGGLRVRWWGNNQTMTRFVDITDPQNSSEIIGNALRDIEVLYCTLPALGWTFESQSNSVTTEGYTSDATQPTSDPADGPYVTYTLEWTNNDITCTMELDYVQLR